MALFRGNGAAGAAILLIAVQSLFITACSDPIPPLTVDKGKNFPTLAVLDLKGQPYTLTLPTDKITVLNIWATWCGPCRYEMPSLQKLADLLDPARFQVIGLAIDDESHPANEFLIERQIRFSNYHDPAQRAIKDLLALRAYPTTYIVVGQRVHRVAEGWRDWSDPAMVTELQALGAALNPEPRVENPPRQPS